MNTLTRRSNSPNQPFNESHYVELFDSALAANPQKSKTKRKRREEEGNSRDSPLLTLTLTLTLTLSDQTLTEFLPSSDRSLPRVSHLNLLPSSHMHGTLRGMRWSHSLSSGSQTRRCMVVGMWDPWLYLLLYMLTQVFILDLVFRPL